VKINLWKENKQQVNILRHVSDVSKHEQQIAFFSPYFIYHSIHSRILFHLIFSNKKNGKVVVESAPILPSCMIESGCVYTSQEDELLAYSRECTHLLASLCWSQIKHRERRPESFNVLVALTCCLI